MKPFDVITEEEQLAIRHYVDNYAEEPLSVDVEYLLREWNTQKANLFDTGFGQQLILKKDIVVKKSCEQICEEMNKCTMPEEARYFERDLVNFCLGKRDELWRQHIYNTPEEDTWYDVESLTSYMVLAKNKTDRDFYINLPKPDGTTRRYHVQEGSKPMRALGKIRAAFNISTEDRFKAYCVWQSRFLNEKELSGKLCLSIHPLDYLTMSHNNNDWTSCMNWPEEGCYRAGTVEMMNSGTVIVAYLESKNTELNIGWRDYVGSKYHDFMWNSKKWRALFVLNEYGLFSVKSYPYYNEDLTKAAMSFIAEKFSERTLCEVMPCHPYSWVLLTPDARVEFEVNPTTDRMYNDFGSTDHWMMLDKNFVDTHQEGSVEINFNYSGLSECMSCGELYYKDRHNHIYFNDTKDLCCGACHPDYDNYDTCEECGCLINPDDTYWVDDTAVCPECFEAHCFEEVWTGDFHFKQDGINLIIRRTDKSKHDFEVGMVTRSHCYYWFNNTEKYKYFEDETKDTYIVDEADFDKDCVGYRYWDRNVLRWERWREAAKEEAPMLIEF